MRNGNANEKDTTPLIVKVLDENQGDPRFKTSTWFSQSLGCSFMFWAENTTQSKGLWPLESTPVRKEEENTHCDNFPEPLMP